jgi:AAA+ superfamily predicted ATPase
MTWNGMRLSVFLRCLEYYQGLMFLTTNRVEEYDPAFSSRIHLKVKFTAPDHCKRATIWRNLLKTVKTCKNWDDAVYERLGKDLDLNGREIKNLIRPALAVAAYKNELLTEDALRLLYRMNHDKA